MLNVLPPEPLSSSCPLGHPLEWTGVTVIGACHQLRATGKAGGPWCCVPGENDPWPFLRSDVCFDEIGSQRKIDFMPSKVTKLWTRAKGILVFAPCHSSEGEQWPRQGLLRLTQGAIPVISEVTRKGTEASACHPRSRAVAGGRTGLDSLPVWRILPSPPVRALVGSPGLWWTGCCLLPVHSGAIGQLSDVYGPDPE